MGVSRLFDIDLLSLFTCLPSSQCLNHSYFSNAPLPTKPEKLPQRAPEPEKVADTLKRKAGSVLTDNDEKLVARSKIARKLTFED